MEVDAIGPTAGFTVFFEESLDCQTWVLGPSTPSGYAIGANEVKFFSYSFRLRWFRLRIELTGDWPIVTCWAEGVLRGGGAGGPWPVPGTGLPKGAIGDLSRAGRPRRGRRGRSQLYEYYASIGDWDAADQVMAGGGAYVPYKPSGTLP